METLDTKTLLYETLLATETRKVSNMTDTTTFEIELSNEAKAVMLGMRVNGLLGDSAYQQLLKLEPNTLDVVAQFCKLVADSKRLEEAAMLDLVDPDSHLDDDSILDMYEEGE